MGSEDVESVMRGTVRGVSGSTVRALLEYGAASERMLCDLPGSFWPESVRPHPDQRFLLRYTSGADQPSVEVLKFRPAAIQETTFVREARQLLGFAPGDKVLVVVGPNPLPQSVGLRNYWLINAGWGEALALTRLPYLLTTIGILPRDIETAICEARLDEFKPKAYADRHIIFLGSTMSNVILREHYWPQWHELRAAYEFVHDPDKDVTALRLHLADGTAPPELTTEDNLRTEGQPNWTGMKVHDYFLLARLPNPYAEKGAGRQCILSCGIGTIGTGYGIVALCARAAVRALLDSTGGGDFDMVGDVDMVGFFNPTRDPLQMLWLNGRASKRNLLRGSLASPAVWDDAGAYTEDDELVDQETLELLLSQDRDDRITRRLSQPR